MDWLLKAEPLRFAAAQLPRMFWNNVPGHTTRAPQVGFELATNGIQFYAIANLDKTSLCTSADAVGHCPLCSIPKFLSLLVSHCIFCQHHCKVARVASEPRVLNPTVAVQEKIPTAKGAIWGRHSLLRHTYGQVNHRLEKANTSRRSFHLLLPGQGPGSRFYRVL